MFCCYLTKTDKLVNLVKWNATLGFSFLFYFDRKTCQDSQEPAHTWYVSHNCSLNVSVIDYLHFYLIVLYLLSLQCKYYWTKLPSSPNCIIIPLKFSISAASTATQDMQYEISFQSQGLWNLCEWCTSFALQPSSGYTSSSSQSV